MNEQHTLKERQAIHWFKLGRYWLQAASQAENDKDVDRYLLRSGRAFKKAYQMHKKVWTLVD